MVGKTLGPYERPDAPVHSRALVGLCAALLLTWMSACALGGDIEWMPEAPERPNVTLRVDFSFEEAHVTNWGPAGLKLRGWRLRCEGSWFNFPDMTLEPGKTVTITNGGLGRHDPPRYLRWRTPNAWVPRRERPVELVDASGNVVARYQRSTGE